MKELGMLLGLEKWKLWKNQLSGCALGVSIWTLAWCFETMPIIFVSIHFEEEDCSGEIV
jgi:hypothetical protein